MNDPTRFPDGTLKPYGAETCTKCAGDGEQATPGISCEACLGTGKKKTDLELAEHALLQARQRLEWAQEARDVAANNYVILSARVAKIKWGGD